MPIEIEPRYRKDVLNALSASGKAARQRDVAEKLTKARAALKQDGLWHWEIGASTIATTGSKEDRRTLLKNELLTGKINSRQMSWLLFLAQNVFPKDERPSDRELLSSVQAYLQNHTIREGIPTFR